MMIHTLYAIICSFGKVGFIALGGGNSMLKLLEYETVTYRHWIAPEEFAQMIGTSFLFPGLTAVKLAALIGYKTAGIVGLLLAIICLNLPGLLLAFIGYQWLIQHNTPFTRKIMVGVQYGAVALLAAATFSVAQGLASLYVSLSVTLLTILFFIALAFFQLSPFWGFLGFISVCFFLVH